jgi:hypothetical protein
VPVFMQEGEFPLKSILGNSGLMCERSVS